jgi:hypothetical protein
VERQAASLAKLNPPELDGLQANLSLGPEQGSLQTSLAPLDFEATTQAENNHNESH